MRRYDDAQASWYLYVALSDAGTILLQLVTLFDSAWA